MEIVVNLISYELFRMCNPFVVSEQVRNSLKDDAWGFKKLLAARWDGIDHTSLHILNKWETIKFSNCEHS